MATGRRWRELEAVTGFVKLGRRHWWSVGGALIGVAAFAVVLWRIDFDKFRAAFVDAEFGYVALAALAIAVEQLVRGWKWRQLLHDIRPVGTLRLFGAIMAGYLVSFLIPFGVSPIVRSWLVARLEGLRMSAVLATAAVDRLVDGVVFTGVVALALGFAVIPDPGGGIRLGLAIGGAGSLAVFVALLFALARYKRHAGRSGNLIERWVGKLPGRLGGSSQDFARSFADGIVWPRARARGFGIIAASIVIKLIAATHFLWAGLAFGVVLRPMEYVFILAFLGFLMILIRVARVPGGVLLGSVFVLELFGIAEEQALAMVLVVMAANLATVGLVGGLALWKNGITIGDLRTTGPRATGNRQGNSRREQ